MIRGSLVITPYRASPTAQQAVKNYVSEGNAYLGCLEEVEKALGAGITAKQKALVTVRYNQVVESIQATASDFNAVVQAFREAVP